MNASHSVLDDRALPIQYLSWHYTYWRNKARSARRIGFTNGRLESQVKAAAKDYYGAIRTSKKSHWQNFSADNTNIWKAAKLLSAACKGHPRDSGQVDPGREIRPKGR